MTVATTAFSACAAPTAGDDLFTDLDTADEESRTIASGTWRPTENADTLALGSFVKLDLSKDGTFSAEFSETTDCVSPDELFAVCSYVEASGRFDARTVEELCAGDPRGCGEMQFRVETYAAIDAADGETFVEGGNPSAEEFEAALYKFEIGDIIRFCDDSTKKKVAIEYDHYDEFGQPSGTYTEVYWKWYYSRRQTMTLRGPNEEAQELSWYKRGTQSAENECKSERYY